MADAPVTIDDDVRLLIVDDDPLVRDAIRAATARSAGIQIAGEAADGEAALAAVAECRPDVVLLDGAIGGLDIVTLTRRIRDQWPDVDVVVFSSEADDEMGIRGLRAGAVGFLVKDLTGDALVRSLHGLGRGEAAVSRALARRIVEDLRATPGAARRMPPASSALTAREWEVLDLICSGRTTDAIAEELGLAIESGRADVKRVLAKLGVASLGEAAQVAGRLRAVERDRTDPPRGEAPR